MIEIPRAAVTADQIAEVADFFSFGTNDLTQMTLGFSRDDIGKFLPYTWTKGSSRPTRSRRSTRTVWASCQNGRIQGPRCETAAQVRYLRRTRRRPRFGGVLPLRGPQLRVLLALPGAHRMAGCRTCRPEITVAYTTDRAGRPQWTARPVCTPSRQQVRGRPSRRTDSGAAKSTDDILRRASSAFYE